MKHAKHARKRKGGFFMKAATSGVCLAAGIVVAASLAIPISAAVADPPEAVTHEAAVAMAASDLPKHDWFDAQKENAERVNKLIEEKKAEQAAQAEAERIAAEEAAAAEAAYWAYDENLNNNPEYLNYGRWDSADGFYSQGVRDGVGSDTETYYSSRVAYHERTGEWTPDEEGYYRDADGYYVVSSDDYGEGEVVQTSKGEGKVYDGGSGSGNFDMYVNW